VSLRAHLAKGALLVSVPDPVVCFAESAYRQAQAFELEAGAALVAVDWMTSGRLGSGERWAFVDYASTTTVRLEGRLAIHDAVRLSRRDGDLAARLGRFDVLAVAVIAGDPLAVEAARVVDAVAAIAPARRPAVMASAAALPGGGGSVVRLAGERVEAVRQHLRALLDFVPALLGDDPWARKW
jgi:urease accessory protein